MLESNYPIIDSLWFYAPDAEGQWKEVLSGDMIPFGERKFRDRRLVFPLHLPSDDTITMYLKVKTASSVQLPLKISHRDVFYQRNVVSEVAYGIFCGAVLVMLLYNLFVFLFLKDINYLYYVISIGAGLVFFGSVNGHTLYL